MIENKKNGGSASQIKSRSVNIGKEEWNAKRKLDNIPIDKRTELKQFYCKNLSSVKFTRDSLQKTFDNHRKQMSLNFNCVERDDSEVFKL